MNTPAQISSPARVVAAWILVIIPLGWGIYQSVVKSVPLFRRTAVRQVNPRPVMTTSKPIVDESALSGPLGAQSPREAQ